MAQYWNTCLMIWEDKNGQQGAMQWTTQDQSNAVPGPIAALGASAQLLSSCKLRAIQYVTTSVAPGAPVDGSYPTFWDRATLLTRTAHVPGQIQIPGPLESIFLPDHNRIDYANPNVIAFANQVKLVLGDKSGSPVVKVYGGSRSRVRSGLVL